MANPDSARLAVDVIARIEKFERELKKAGRVADANFGKVEKRGKQMATRLERDLSAAGAKISATFANFGKGLVGGIAAGGIAGIISQFRDVSKAVASVGDEARRAGVNVEAFQEWKFVAEQNRIGVDALTDGLKELNLRADEFVQTGKGSAAEAFMRLGYGTDELARKLQNPSELLLEIIGRLGSFERAAQIRISDELFGGSAGERFVELLDQGEQGIRDTIEEAHRLGAVMDQELIEKAAELDRRFNAITTAVGTGLKTAIVEAASALQDFIDTFSGWWSEMEKRRGAAIAGAQVGAMAGNTAAAGRVVRTTPKTDRLPKAPFVPPTPPPGGFGSGGGSTRDAAAAAAEREAEAVARLISELQEELRLVGASTTEKEIAATLRRANVDAASEEGRQIAALVTQIESETEALERNQKAQEARADSIDYLFGVGEDALTSIIDGSMRAEDAIKRLAVQLALAAAQAALLGTGPLAGLFGVGKSLLGGLGGGVDPWAGMRGFATGTANTGGTRGQSRGVVHGQEAVIPLPNGGRVPVDIRVPKIGGTGSAAASGPVNINVNVEGANGDQHVIALVEQGVTAGIRQYDRGSAGRLSRDAKLAPRRYRGV